MCDGDERWLLGYKNDRDAKVNKERGSGIWNWIVYKYNLEIKATFYYLTNSIHIYKEMGRHFIIGILFLVWKEKVE